MAGSGQQSGQQSSRLAHFHVPARLEEAAALSAAVRAFLDGHAAPEVCNGIELGINEAFNNIVLHGRPDAMADVRCRFNAGFTQLVIEIEDQGTPIPPDVLEAAGSQVFEFDENDLQSLPEGGMGLALLKMSFDQVDYSSSEGVNRLRLEKHIEPPA